MPAKNLEGQIKAMNVLSAILLLTLLLGVGGVLWKAMSTFEAMMLHNTKMLELVHNATDKTSSLETDYHELKIRVIALEASGKVAKKKRAKD